MIICNEDTDTSAGCCRQMTASVENIAKKPRSMPMQLTLGKLICRGALTDIEMFDNIFWPMIPFLI